MSSLSDVVSAMSKEANDSTLGWDVVVNYTAKDLNDVLKAAYDKGPQGQLKELSVSIDIEEEISGLRYRVDYIFKLGSPLIQFMASPMMTSACELDMEVIGGSVKVEQYGKEYIIPKGRYRLLLSGIALASINGTQGADRNPKPSDQPFVFDSPNTTGGVSLDLETSAKENRLLVELSVLESGDKISLIDNHLGELEKKVLTQLKQSEGIHWDLAQVNNTRPSTGTTQLVPKVFRFACYAPSSATSSYTILSIFIHLDGGDHSGAEAKLQEKWSVQWAEPDAQSPNSYGVPPIPDSYTASVIFNHGWIKNLVKKSVEQAGMKLEEIPKTSTDTWGVKWKILTGKQYDVKRIDAKGSSWPYSHYIVDGITVNLDNLAEPDGALYMSIGQNGETQANALLKWQFNYTTGWSWIHGGTGDSVSGKVKVTNALDKKNGFDNNALVDYRVHLNIHTEKKDWRQDREPSDSTWYSIINATDYGNVSFNALPDPPTFDLEVFDIDFFMTTNLLLPNSNVINFKADPGVRFPRDLYLVGHIINDDELKHRRQHHHRDHHHHDHHHRDHHHHRHCHCSSQASTE